MSRIKELEALIEAKQNELKPLKDELQQLREARGAEVLEQIKLCHKLKHKFDPSELRYSRVDRCPCGAGVAYHKETLLDGAWHCAAILTGTADVEKEHISSYPFSMYEIKSETNDQTTRP